jgi:hypothetical protein
VNGRIPGGTPGADDLADIDVTPPPSSWSPELVDATPNPADVTDHDEEPNA